MRLNTFDAQGGEKKMKRLWLELLKYIKSFQINFVMRLWQVKI